MLEDRLLLWRFKNGSEEAFGSIYNKYEKYLLKLAATLLGDSYAAEDVVHDVFSVFIQSRDKVKLNGSLKSYLTTCVANLARDKIRNRKRTARVHESIKAVLPDVEQPDAAITFSEESAKTSCALAQLPYEQREVIILHLISGMKFREIAVLHDVSVNTIKSRYRYGLEKLRSLLNSEVKNNEKIKQN